MKAYEYGKEYDVGESECPDCGYPIVGYFQNGILVKRDHCASCGWKEVR